MKKLKCTLEDYTESDLPQTRREMLKECYKEQLSLILRLGFLCLVCFLPQMIVSMLRDMHVAMAIASLAEQTKEAVARIVYYSDMVYGLFGIFTFSLLFCLLSGAVQIVRQMVWGEPVFFGDDFKNGMKSNGVRFFVLAFLVGANGYLLRLLNGSTVSYILLPVYLILVIPVIVWTATQGLYYKLGWIAGLKNGVLLYVKTFPATLLMTACTVIPFYLALNFISLFLAKYLVLIVLAVVYLPFLMMAWASYACSIFDRYVNKENYPSIYRKGLGSEEQGNEP